MRRLHMSAKEILDSYRNAKHQKDQIRILAELNAVSEAEIVEVLKGLGVEPPKDGRKCGWPKGRPRKAKPELTDAATAGSDNAATVAGPGRAKPEQADAGAPQGAAEAEQREEIVEQKEQRTPMGVAALNSVVRQVAEGFPQTEVRMKGGTVTGATLTVSWDELGQVTKTVLVIEGG